MSDLKKRFGRLVAACRRIRGMTRQELSDAAQISIEMISRIENGRSGARFETVERIAAALQVDVSELFGVPAANGVTTRPALMNLSARLAKLSDKDLEWVDQLLDTALRSRG